MNWNDAAGKSWMYDQLVRMKAEVEALADKLEDDEWANKFRQAVALRDPRNNRGAFTQMKTTHAFECRARVASADAAEQLAWDVLVGYVEGDEVEAKRWDISIVSHRNGDGFDTHIVATRR